VHKLRAGCRNYENKGECAEEASIKFIGRILAEERNRGFVMLWENKETWVWGKASSCPSQAQGPKEQRTMAKASSGCLEARVPGEET
jgi:hypothetical protein